MGYVLDGRDSISGRERCFFPPYSTESRQAFKPTQPPIQRKTEAILLWVKLPGLEAGSLLRSRMVEIYVHFAYVVVI
jgi:hypothetical protein